MTDNSFVSLTATERGILAAALRSQRAAPHSALPVPPAPLRA
ncbi:hypothetical protein [Deinococcus sp. DB0503]|nr:hypothetical protein [Deinococcus sp. DB0503]